MKKLSKILATGLMIGGALIGSMAHARNYTPSVEKGLKALNRIYQTSLDQTDYMLGECVRVYFHEMCDKNGNNDHYATPEEMWETARDINHAVYEFADQKFGDKDGKTDFEELNAMKRDRRTKALIETIIPFF